LRDLGCSATRASRRNCASRRHRDAGTNIAQYAAHRKHRTTTYKQHDSAPDECSATLEYPGFESNEPQHAEQHYAAADDKSEQP
jgi:hypothetical protein